MPLIASLQKKAKPEKKEIGVIAYNIATPAGEKKGDKSYIIYLFVFFLFCC